MIAIQVKDASKVCLIRTLYYNSTSDFVQALEYVTLFERLGSGQFGHSGGSYGY